MFRSLAWSVLLAFTLGCAATGPDRVTGEPSSREVGGLDVGSTVEATLVSGEVVTGEIVRLSYSEVVIGVTVDGEYKGRVLDREEIETIEIIEPADSGKAMTYAIYGVAAGVVVVTLWFIGEAVGIVDGFAGME